jgi:hypothetical protein
MIWEKHIQGNQHDCKDRSAKQKCRKVDHTPMDYDPNVHEPVADDGVTHDAK